MDAIGGRTDPDPCEDDGPQWARLYQKTTLVHTCLITNKNTTSGRVRAEAQLQSNRRFITKVTVPSGADYVWNQGSDGALGEIARRMMRSFGLVAPGEEVLAGQSKMTAGYMQPRRSKAQAFTLFLDHWSLLFSTASGLLGLAPLPDTRGGLAVLWAVKSCASDIPRKLRDSDGWWQAILCVFNDALPQLRNPAKARSVMIGWIGDRAYTENVDREIGSLADRAELIGKAAKAVSVGFFVRDVFQQIPDAFAQMGSDRTGDVVLSLDGTAPTPPEVEELVLSLNGLGPLTYGMSVAQIEATSMATQERCPPIFGDPNDPSSAPLQWVPDAKYRLSRDQYPFHAFEISTLSTGTLTVIDVLSPRIRTDTGLSLGSTLDQMKAVYGERLKEQPLQSPAQTSHVYAVEGDRSALLFEVSRYDDESMQIRAGDVWLMRLLPRGGGYQTLAGTDAGAGGC